MPWTLLLGFGKKQLGNKKADVIRTEGQQSRGAKERESQEGGIEEQHDSKT
jgi:hypothetical protein